MKHTKKMQVLLERMAKIERMERGKLCQMGGRPHYNHQTWENGKNVVRYVPERETGFLKVAIEGYQAFIKLAEQYADEVIKQTRRERAKAFPTTTKAKPTQKGKPQRDGKIHS
jgi:hypothetical protein